MTQNTFAMWQCVKTLCPCSSHQNSWDLWMFIPLKMVLIGIDPYSCIGLATAGLVLCLWLCLQGASHLKEHMQNTHFCRRWLCLTLKRPKEWFKWSFSAWNLSVWGIPWPSWYTLLSDIGKWYPLVNVYITMERSIIFNGSINYFDWAIFNSKLLVITRGYLQWYTMIVLLSLSFTIIYQK